MTSYTDGAMRAAQQLDIMSRDKALAYEQAAAIISEETGDKRLIEALEEALEPFRHAVRNPSGEYVGEPMWCAKARAAIARAKGGKT